MKLPLILAAALVLVACQVQALFDPDGSDDSGFYYGRRGLPHAIRPEVVQPHVESDTRRATGVGLLIIDKIFHTIREIAERIASILERMKDPFDKIGYSNFSELLTSLAEALHKFSKNVGGSSFPQRGKRDTQLNYTQCQPHDPRPECQRDRSG